MNRGFLAVGTRRGSRDDAGRRGRRANDRRPAAGGADGFRELLVAAAGQRRSTPPILRRSFDGRILHLSLARHRRRHPRRRSREPLRHARLPRALDGTHRRKGDGSRRGAGHQGRAVGGQANVGAGRRGEERHLLLYSRPRTNKTPSVSASPSGAHRGPFIGPAPADPGQLLHRSGGVHRYRRQDYMYFGGIWGGQLQR